MKSSKTKPEFPSGKAKSRDPPAEGGGPQAKARGPPVEELVPPDGGWGWFIVLGSGIMQFVLPSLSTCFGLIYVHLVASGYSNSQVSPIPGLMIGMTCLTGPVATSLTRYYSHRRLSIIGICLSVMGIFLCSFWDDLYWYYVCFGVIGGVGNGLANPHGFILGQMYFRRRRVAANALSMLGSSLGFMVMPPLVRFLANTYAHQGALLLWSAILLHGLVGAALYQPVEWHLKPNPLANVRLVEARPCQEEGHVADADEEEVEDGNQDGSYPSESGGEYEEGDEESLQQGVAHRHSDPQRRRESAASKGEAEVFLGRESSERPLRGGRRRLSSCTRTSVRNSLYSSCDVIDQFGGALSVETERLKDVYVEVVEKVEEKPKEPQPFILCGLKFPRFSDILNFRILSHPMFLISSISSIANRMVYMNFITYLPALGVDLGMQNEAPFLLTTVSVADLAAKGIMSLISDRGWCQRRYFAIIAGVFACVTASLVPQTWNFTSLASCCALYGFSLGVMVSVSPILLVEYLGLKLLPHSFGLLLFMNGVSSLIIFPLTGHISDVMANYTTIYYLLGGLSLTPSILWSLVPFVNQDKIRNLV
ncbi:monocarboxylate transporter 13-like isoform X1 [Penaeus chinensis]|uniref:monocarboxylate transporter 13-like isoform X1 n=1 Tax=Penaeus chinensis TaxID=139456 RepID=UPI001FB7A165|nr:monocarboxylate transporter 13-like isoform X1 [Penaeus chinensis]